LPGDDLDALRLRLDDAAQVAAVGQLQAARWGAGNPSQALASLRTAFAKGLKLRSSQRQPDIILPPLYPQA
ncbi:MAG: protein BatD, partial [Thermomonas sp.]